VIEKVEHLLAVDRRTPRDENQHVTWSDDLFVFSLPLLFWRQQSQNFVRRQERPLNLLYAFIHVVEHWRTSRAAVGECSLLDGLCPGHFAQKFRGVVLVGCESDANLAIADDALVGARIMTFPSRYVVLSNEPMGMLYTMRSPDFKPRHYNPLDYLAIGSGHEMQEFIGQVSGQIFSGMPMQHGDASWLGRSMNHFLRKKNIESVGGMFPMIKLQKPGAIHVTRQVCQLPNGPAHELAFQNDRWVQRNITTGYEVELALPWELDQSIRTNQRFDEVRPSSL